MKLNMPENITLRQEFWRGFGKSEATITAIVLVLSSLLSILYVQMQSSSIATVQAVFAIILSVFLTVLFVTKFAYNQSILDYIWMILCYHREQQSYYYKNDEVITTYVETEKTAKH